MLSYQLMLKRRRFVGWLNAGLFVFVTVVIVAVASSVRVNLDVAVVAGVVVLSGVHIVGGIGLVLEKRWGALVLWPVSILDLVGFPIGTLLGLYNLYILYETREQTGISSRTLAIVSAVPVLLLVFMVSQQLGSRTTRSPAKPLLEAIAAQGGTREFQRWLSTLPEDSIKAATAIARLEAQGLLRLDTAIQLTRLRLTSDGLKRLSIHDCASFARGVATLEQQRAFVSTFDSASLAQWMEIRAEAILAGLHDSTPATSASDSEIKDYSRFVYRRLSQADQHRYQLVIDSGVSASDPDECWLARLYYSRATEPGASRSQWVRVVTTQTAANR